ncbi:MAG: lytic transglycosylase [Neomegalonema sp.]|nr:lytic transglycosylase [Neomegalonema sp.]
MHASRPLLLVGGAALICALLASCATLKAPRRQNDVCAMLATHPEWRRAVRRTERKWGAPAHVQLAIIWKESSFRHDARPPRKRILFGLAPWGRVSSAYGYSQALDGTWKRYLRETGRSSWAASRTDFGDSSDFIGWYMATTQRVNGVPMSDAITQYLNYHEGHAGYRRGSYRRKAWLIRAARRAGRQAERYRKQMRACP